MNHSFKISPGIIAVIMFIYAAIPFAEIFPAADSLKYIGHSFVKLKTSQGKVIYIDPYSKNDFTDSADVVLITHEHSDHNEIGRVVQKKTCTVIRPGSAIVGGAYQSFAIGNIKIKAVAAYNSNHSKSSSVGYVIEFNGIKIYHAGDTGNINEMADLAAEKITYSMIPMDGIYTMSPEIATQAASIIKAKYDIPIHTMAPPDTYSDAIAARFTSANKLIVKPGTTVALSSVATSIKKKELPDEFLLNQNFPNPFNPYTIIGWQINFSGHVTLKVYDLLGRELTTLVDEYAPAGMHHTPFSMMNLPEGRRGSQAASGIYYYTLATTQGSISKKMMILK